MKDYTYERVGRAALVSVLQNGQRYFSNSRMARKMHT
jgi:hypothetical protein